jgi:ribosome-associated translation inhibitor RaiA
MIMTSCRVEVEVASLPGTVVAEAYEPNPYRAVDNAIERLSLSLHGEVRRKPTRSDVGPATPSRASNAMASWQSA